MMDWIGRLARRLARRVAVVLGRGGVERGMTEEMRFHLEMEERELVASGHAPAEARRLARVRFGGVERYKEEVRDARGVRLLEDVGQDVRYALRGLRRRPGFAAAVIATLAVAIGATTAVWSVVDVSLLRPLPYPEGDRLVRIQASWEGEPNGALSPAEYLDVRRGGGEVFEALGAYVQTAVTVGPVAGGSSAAGGASPGGAASAAASAGGSGATAERVDAAAVSAELFDALDVAPLLGRPFAPSEELSGEAVVVLSEGFWRQRFGAAPDVVGATVSVNGSPFAVVGVMPGDFRLPENMLEGTRPRLFVPLGIDPDTTYERGSHFLQAAGRLRADVTIARAAAAVEGIVDRFSADFPDDYEPEMGYRATAVPLRNAVVGDAEPALFAALGAVLMVLLVGAANVAALLLTRGEARRGEVALRSTLGARRSRLVRQMLVETLVLGLIGGALGVALAVFAVDALVALRPTGIPRLEELAVDGPVLAFAAALSVACGLLFGLVPALRVAPDHAGRELREAAARSPGRRSRRARRVLVVAEIGLALTLVTGAGLLGRTMAEMLAVDIGVRIDDVVSTEFGVPSSRYPEAEDVRDFAAVAVERVALLPEVTAAGVVTNLPLADGIGDLGVMISGKDVPGDGALDVDWQAATPGYHRAIGLRLLEGRWIRDSDRADAEGAVVINRTFAERWWPDGDALGATIRLTAETAPGEARVVGIVEDVKHEGPTSSPRLQIYIPHRQFRFWYGGGAARGLTLVARTAPGSTTAPAAIRAVFAELDPEQGLGPFLTLEQAYHDVFSRPRLVTALLGVFAAIALLLAALGVYGVMAYSVRRRHREFGIRAALGARGTRIARAVVQEGVALGAAGVALGTLGSLVLARTLRSLLFGVSARDPWVLAAGAGVLLLVSLLASWAPARRALRVPPAEALRAE